MTEITQKAPKVSIGLPVYNGERYLAAAIESILGQTFRDFELIISDNASTDRTAEICRFYAAQDARIFYSRNAQNLGAGPNYDLCFERARGHYFKWAAHDDLMAPTYLERTVAAMDANPDAVLCCVGIIEIDESGKHGRVYSNNLPGIDSPRPSTRLGGMIHAHHECEDFFGLYRREALIGTQLHGNYTGSDRGLLAEIAMRGRCITVSEPLFLHREHPDRFTRLLIVNREKSATWQDTKARDRRRMFYLPIYRQFWGLVNKTVKSPGERLACYGQLLRWWWTGNHLRDTAKDIIWVVSPSLLRMTLRIKQALFGVSKPLPPGAVKRVR